MSVKSMDVGNSGILVANTVSESLTNGPCGLLLCVLLSLYSKR